MKSVLTVLIEFCRVASLVTAAAMAVGMMCAAMSGCATRDKSQDAKGILGTDESAFKLVIIMDHDAVVNADSWKFVCYTLDHYFMSRIGDPADEVLLCGVVENERSLLWQGTPRHLREEFPSQEAFKTFMEGKLWKARSAEQRQTHRGISRSLRYVMSLPAVRSHQAKTVTLILSNLIDRSPDAEETADELLNDCVKYLKGGGEIGFYRTDQEVHSYWQDKFEKAGYPLIPIAPDIHGRPPLPDFERIR